MGRKLCRIILVVLLMIDLVTSVMLVGAAYEFDLPSVFESYALRSSLVDSLAISAARVVALSTQSWLGWWVGFASGVLAISKAMVYSHESEPVAANALIFFAVAMAVVELLLCSRCMALSRRCAAVHELSSKATTSPDAEKASYETKLQLLLHPPPSSIRGTMKILQPYFWPAGIVNKLRTFATFLIMGGSKACNLFAPLAIGAAAQTLSDGAVPYRELSTYCAFRFGSSALSELQKLIYIGVKQHAFAEIAENTFHHLLGLSLDWHLTKKMGEVLRVMDRGISSADSVMNYLVLFLLPSLVECAVTLVLFFVHFDSPELTATAFLSFVLYIVLTVQITQWRKKFRAGQNKSDNKYHDLATDSLVNFETVKYFANEPLEVAQFKKAVQSFQSFNIGVQASLSLLNSSQQLDIQVTTLICLCLAATTILHQSHASGEPVAIGQFVSVNAYVLQLFAPLSFLGTIYSTVIQAFIDMNNLSQLLLLSPDVKDAPHAPALRLADASRGAALEFRRVSFSYPTQPTRGLRDVQFVTPAGSTTAIVGPTGAGTSPALESPRTAFAHRGTLGAAAPSD